MEETVEIIGKQKKVKKDRKGRFWNRSWLAWINFMFFIFNTIIVVISILKHDTQWYIYLNAFAAGLCFSYFLWEGFMNTLRDIVEHSLVLNKLLLEKIGVEVYGRN